MANVFVTRQLPGTALEQLDKHHVDVWSEHLPPTSEELQMAIGETEGLLCMLDDQITAEVIEAAPKLRAIATYAVGFNNIDLEASNARGIKVGNTPDVLTEASADLAFALLMTAARKIIPASENARNGKWHAWEPQGFLGADVHGATLGIIGYGRIGKAVAKRATGFEMEVLHHSRSGGVPLEELLERSDFISLHCPLTPETSHLINEAALKRMKNSAVLINTARGPVVNQTALVTALHEGWIAGAALDVTDPEPPAPDDPLLNAPNLTLVPHIGSATTSTRVKMAEMAVANLLAGLDGRPMPHAVN